MLTVLLHRTNYLHLYPDSLVTPNHGALREASPQLTAIEFADGSDAFLTLFRVDNNAPNSPCTNM